MDGALVHVCDVSKSDVYRVFVLKSEDKARWDSVHGMATLRYRVIQSSTTILKDAVGEIIWSIKCKCIFFPFRFITVSELRRFCFDVILLSLLIFTKWKQLVSTLTTVEFLVCDGRKRNKARFAFCSISQSSLQSTFFVWFSVRVMSVL
jgi:hypothetical protein